VHKLALHNVPDFRLINGQRHGIFCDRMITEHGKNAAEMIEKKHAN